jgi:hypothetical protein
VVEDKAPEDGGGSLAFMSAIGGVLRPGKKENYVGSEEPQQQMSSCLWLQAV